MRYPSEELSDQISNKNHFDKYHNGADSFAICSEDIQSVVDVFASIGSGPIPEGYIALGSTKGDKIEDCDEHHCLAV